MDNEMKVVFVRTQTLCAELRMQGMVAENIDASRANRERPYRLKDFEQVAIDFGITHNQVISYFMD